MVTEGKAMPRGKYDGGKSEATAQQENSHVRFDSYILPLQMDVKFEQKKIQRCVDTVSLS